MKPNELREMSDEQLQFNLREAQTRLFKLKIEATTDKVSPSLVKKTRADVARIQTILRERELIAGV